MKKAVLLSASATLVASSAALADVAGIYGQDTLRYYAADGNTVTNLANASFAVLDLYVDFSATNTSGYSNDDSVLLSIFNVNVTADGFDNFRQTDVFGQGSGVDGTWRPQFSIDSEDFNSAIDSFVTIGGGVGTEAPVNSTNLDPGFLSGTNPDIFLTNVGWFNGNPTNYQGAVDTMLTVGIGRFVITGAEARDGAYFDLIGTVGYNHGSGSSAEFAEDQGASFTFIPSPGPLALLGMSALCLRRRRN